MKQNRLLTDPLVPAEIARAPPARRKFVKEADRVVGPQVEWSKRPARDTAVTNGTIQLLYRVTAPVPDAFTGERS